MCICFGGAAGANFIFESCFLWYTWPDNTSRLLNGVTALGTNSVRGDTWLQISIISTSLENPLLYLPTPLGYQKLIITFTVHTFVDCSMHLFDHHHKYVFFTPPWVIRHYNFTMGPNPLWSSVQSKLIFWFRSNTMGLWMKFAAEILKFFLLICVEFQTFRNLYCLSSRNTFWEKN